MLHDHLFNIHIHLAREGHKPSPIKGNGFTCSCPLPGHGKGRGDRNPSLSVYEDSNGIVHLHCHAGCDPLHITEYLGLKPVDLGYGGDATHDIVYDYLSPEGTLLYQVVRKPGKQFRQRRPDPDTQDGGWIWNLKGTEAVPYNLPGILRGDDPILIVEGEKDANTLIDRGYVATTNSGGAGKWPDVLTKYFRDRLVYVLCDNDEPGRRHQLAVASALVTVAEKVIVVPPFEDAKDVSEWFVLGHSDNEFAAWLNRGEEQAGVARLADAGGPGDRAARQNVTRVSPDERHDTGGPGDRAASQDVPRVSPDEHHDTGGPGDRAAQQDVTRVSPDEHHDTPGTPGDAGVIPGATQTKPEAGEEAVPEGGPGLQPRVSDQGDMKPGDKSPGHTPTDTTSSSPAPSVLDFRRIRADALLAKDLPEPRWVVPGLLCEGLAILAGKPKSGKSWIALEVGMAVATGERALGLGECERGSVLMLSLEDSERRVQDRMRTLGGAALAETDLSRLDIVVAQALTLAQIDWWLSHRGDARLVIIDTFGRWREPQEKNTSLYDHDTQSASGLQRLALKHRVCLLLIHHTRKQVDDNDPLVEISGSFGLSGAADTLLVMRRKRGHDLAELFVTGRDIDEARHRMEFVRADERANAGGADERGGAACSPAQKTHAGESGAGDPDTLARVGSDNAAPAGGPGLQPRVSDHGDMKPGFENPGHTPTDHVSTGGPGDRAATQDVSRVSPDAHHDTGGPGDRAATQDVTRVSPDAHHDTPGTPGDAGMIPGATRKSPLRHTGWQITGEIEDDERDMLEGKRRRIIEVLEMEGQPMTNADIAASVGINKTYLSELLRKMKREGLVVNVSRGEWYLPDNPNSPK